MYSVLSFINLFHLMRLKIVSLSQMVVQQLMAQVDTYRESEAQLRIE